LDQTAGRAHLLGFAFALLLPACAGNGTEPSADRLLQGTWGARLYVPPVVLTASANDATLQLGCQEYRLNEPIRLRGDRTFSVAATRMRGPQPGEGHRLEGRLQTDGTVLLYVLPQRKAGAPGGVASFVAPAYELTRGDPHDFVRPVLPAYRETRCE
jgi:hypothetical protein